MGPCHAMPCHAMPWTETLFFFLFLFFFDPVTCLPKVPYSGKKKCARTQHPDRASSTLLGGELPHPCTRKWVSVQSDLTTSLHTAVGGRVAQAALFFFFFFRFFRDVYINTASILSDGFSVLGKAQKLGEWDCTFLFNFPICPTFFCVCSYYAIVVVPVFGGAFLFKACIHAELIVRLTAFLLILVCSSFPSLAGLDSQSC
ncbi:hypothetical protein SEUBUCD646_0I01180 [Saccharomyces eubayanus]|uniref:Uncharacterized protein n=1 Tax=Saccharomyces eubayanus TaxID=1080349 RepID=A0ABN8VV14_SACEU|nr:hypothetical protein SEUBUCD650_0I01180 [Saccharomyces eubayanus]CAI2049970.1 hypothetical protein SEUBUCD646_0I01180 [Saccharomyces eubayanus]